MLFVPFSLQNRLTDPPTPTEQGTLFESWVVREFVRIRDYEEKEHEFTLWRRGPHEIEDWRVAGLEDFLRGKCQGRERTYWSRSDAAR